MWDESGRCGGGGFGEGEEAEGAAFPGVEEGVLGLLAEAVEEEVGWFR